MESARTAAEEWIELQNEKRKKKKAIKSIDEEDELVLCTFINEKQVQGKSKFCQCWTLYADIAFYVRSKYVVYYWWTVFLHVQ